MQKNYGDAGQEESQIAARLWRRCAAAAAPTVAIAVTTRKIPQLLEVVLEAVHEESSGGAPRSRQSPPGGSALRG